MRRLIDLGITRGMANSYKPPASDLSLSASTSLGYRKGAPLTLWYYHSHTLPMKTAVSIPGPVFQAAERLAKRLGIPRSRLYSCAIELYVAQAQERDVTALLNEVYGGETARLDPTLSALQSASITRDPW
jgi:hypothetical protein